MTLLSPVVHAQEDDQQLQSRRPQDIAYASYVSAIDASRFAAMQAGISATSSASLSYARISETGSATTTPAWVKITTRTSVPAFKSFSTPNASPDVIAAASTTTPILGTTESTQAVTSSEAGSNGNNNALAIGLGVGLGGGALLAIIAGAVLIARKRKQTKKSFEKRTATLAQRMSEANV